MALKIILLGAALLGVAGCAQGPTRSASDDPVDVVQQICQTGANIEAVKGSVWLKAKSTDASGQFPAQVSVKAPSQLQLEVTNLVGGTEATIAIDGDQYVITIPKKKNKLEKRGVSSWGGIPLQWANELFLGRIPCPSPKRLSEWKGTWGGEKEEVIVELPASSGGASEKLTYRYKNYIGQPWPESLVWQRESSDSDPVSVEFKFSDPEDQTRSPKRWEARSRDGEVKVRWRDREVQSKE